MSDRRIPVQRGDNLIVCNLPSLTNRQNVAMDISRREAAVFGRKTSELLGINILWWLVLDRAFKYLFVSFTINKRQII